MNGFEFAKNFRTNEEKMFVLFLDAVKTAYHMAGKDFDSLSQEDKMSAVMELMNK